MIRRAARIGLVLWRQRRALRIARPGTAADERGDVIAYLTRKRANAETIAARNPEFEAEARWTIRQIDVFTDDLKAGLHEGEVLRAGSIERES